MLQQSATLCFGCMSQTHKVCSVTHVITDASIVSLLSAVVVLWVPCMPGAGSALHVGRAHALCVACSLDMATAALQRYKCHTSHHGGRLHAAQVQLLKASAE